MIVDEVVPAVVSVDTGFDVLPVWDVVLVPKN